MSDKHGFVTAWLCAAFMAAFSTASAILATVIVAHAEPVQSEIVYVGGTAAFDEMKGGVTRNIPMSLTSGGFHRTFLVHVPTKFKPNSDQKLPVVVMLHAAGGDGAGAVRQTRWDQKADEETFLAVFPDALPRDPAKPVSARSNPRVWNDGNARAASDRSQVDDIAFIGAMLDEVGQRYPVDKNRIYVTGFANGGSMAFHVAASALANRIAAAAPVSGYFYAAATASQPRPVPLLLIVGTRDPVDPIEGGIVNRLNGEGQTQKPSVADTVVAWAKLDGCVGKPALISNEHGVKRLAYGPGKDGVAFLYWTIDGMGHQWPGSKTDKRPKSVIGESSDKLTTDNIWTFLSRHTLALRADAT